MFTGPNDLFTAIGTAIIRGIVVLPLFVGLAKMFLAKILQELIVVRLYLGEASQNVLMTGLGNIICVFELV